MSDENKATAVEKGENPDKLSPGAGENADQGVADEQTRSLPVDMFYEYEKLYSRPTITTESDMPENLLNLSHSFGYDCGRRNNLQLLDEHTLAFVAGNLLVLLDITSKMQRYLRSCSGRGIGAITTPPSRRYLAVAEKGNRPNIIIYEYPSLRPYRILRGGTQQVYSFLDFNSDSRLLASVGAAPDYMLTLWDWRQEEVTLSCKAVSQEVFRVTFSPHDPGTLTSSGSGHIKFWKMASSFTGLKLQGLMGHFGKTTATDIEGYVELPDGKVVSGSDWGNLLLWEGNAIKVEICRKEGRSCHAGTALPFALEEGQLMTMGSDGTVRGWDLDSIDVADVQNSNNGGRFEMEPMNELVIGHNVSLVSAVKSCLADTFIWFAQDSSGGIWKLDLSFTNTSADPQCLFSFHSGAIQGMDISRRSHLMATTALDRSVRVFDFLAKKELTISRFNQGGSTLRWAPPLVNPSGGLLVAGFEDGVIRLLQLHDLHKLNVVTGRSRKGEAELCLNQAFKPHNAPVTAVAYDRNGQMLATGSSDCTVFFFTVGDKYEPVGFIQVPGPVQGLEWSPQAHMENTLLILCGSGHVVEVQSPNPKTKNPNKTFELPDMRTRTFRFRSIKSRLKREEEITRRQVLKEKKKKEMEEKQKESNPPVEAEEEEEDEEEELPPIHIPDPPSPLACGFYSQPGHFWLSMGGYDSGYLYHCKFSEKQDQEMDQRQDEPFDTLPIHDADQDPILCITFSSNRRLLFCGMNSGSIRVYPLQDTGLGLTSMKAYWMLSVHDNHYGHLRHIGCSHDDLFVLTAGDDGNIFSFSLLPPEKLQRTKADVPSPRVDLENEDVAQDIQDPTAYSIEMAKQKMESDRLRREAELMKVAKRKKLEDLRKNFKELKDMNQTLPKHVHLPPQEFVLDPCFAEEAEQLKVQKIEEVRKELAWKEERWRIARNKLLDRFKDSLGVVTLAAIRSDHRISTYRLLAPPQPLDHVGVMNTDSGGGESAAAENGKPRTKPEKDDATKEDEVAWRPLVAARSAGVKLADRQVERLQKAAEKAQQARAKIQKRKQEWSHFYAEKPDDDFEDPRDVQAILEATEDIRHDTMSRRQGRMNVQTKTEELMDLEAKVHAAQTHMNNQIVELRDSKLRLLALLRDQTRQLQRVRRRLLADVQSPTPLLPRLLPEEEPEKRLHYDRTTLQRYRELRGTRSLDQDQDQEGVPSLLDHLDKEMEGQEKTEEEKEDSRSQSEEDESVVEDGVELSELEAELQREKHLALKYEQEHLLDQMETAVSVFDAQLMLLLEQKLRLDLQLKQADLHQLTLYQDLLVLQDFQGTEDHLNQRLNQRVQEESSIKAKLGEYKEHLQSKHKLISKLQDKIKELTTDFHTSLGQDNKFEEFLTQVFHKNIKRVKKKKKKMTGAAVVEEEEEEEEEDGSDEDSDEDDYSKIIDNGKSPVDEPMCPPKCDPELFQYTLQLRERRLDLEDLLLEEKKNGQALKKDWETLLKKEESVKSSRKTVEDEMELVNREKQQKMDELCVVVPLRLHQIEYVINGSVPDDLSEVLVLDRKELNRLQERIKQLQEEKSQQRERLRQARQQQMKLSHDHREKEAKVQELEKQCSELMMMKFGRQVDLEALQTLSGNRRLEELKQEKLLKEAEYAKELKEWDLKVSEAQEVLDGVTRTSTERMQTMIGFLENNRDLEKKLNARQKKTGGHFDNHRRREDQEAIQRLQDLVQSQSHQADALRTEIRILSRQGGSIQPPSWSPPPLLPPIPQHGHLPTPTKKPGV